MKAKLFANGGSQAVRLPAACRFEGDAVEIERDPATGVVILRPLRPSVQAWFMQRSGLFQQLRLVLPQLAPAIAAPRRVRTGPCAPPLDQTLLLDAASLGALLCGMDPQLDDWLEQGRCAVAAIHALAIESTRADHEAPLEVLLAAQAQASGAVLVSEL